MPTVPAGGGEAIASAGLTVTAMVLLLLVPGSEACSVTARGELTAAGAVYVALLGPVEESEPQFAPEQEAPLCSRSPTGCWRQKH